MKDDTLSEISGPLPTIISISQAENVTVLDTREDKLNWIFMAFDQDGGGYIDGHEIRDIVICLFRWGLGRRMSLPSKFSPLHENLVRLL